MIGLLKKTDQLPPVNSNGQKRPQGLFQRKSMKMLYHWPFRGKYTQSSRKIAY